MKRIAVGVAGSLLLMLLFVGFSAGQGKTFNGEIMDEHCAQAGGSHDALIKEHNLLKKEACVLYCAHHRQPNSKYVLYDDASKAIYQVDNQELVQPYVGAKVQLTGTESNKAIKVTGIKSAI